MAKKQQAKSFYDAKIEHPSFNIGDVVYLKPSPQNRGKQWLYGYIQEIPAPRSYVIKTAEGLFHRNRNQLRSANQIQVNPHSQGASETEHSRPQGSTNTPGQKCPALNVNVPNLISDSSYCKPSVSNTVLSDVKFDNNLNMSDTPVSSNKNDANDKPDDSSIKADNLTDLMNNEPLQPARNQSPYATRSARVVKKKIFDSSM